MADGRDGCAGIGPAALADRRPGTRTEALGQMAGDRLGGRWRMAGVAALAFWIGMNRVAGAGRSRRRPLCRSQTAPVAQQPAPAEPQVEEVQPAPMPEVELSPAPAPVIFRQRQEVRAAIEPVRRAPERQAIRACSSRLEARAQRGRGGSEQAGRGEEAARLRRIRWDSSEASGRMVRVGTYANLRQGKQAWSRLAKVFPGMKKLPAVVTDIPSQRNGKVYYRLQIGTTSQAHSEVLCQRMKAIGQSCVVVDLGRGTEG